MAYVFAPVWLLAPLLWVLGAAVAVVLVYLAASVVLIHWQLKYRTPLTKIATMPCPLCGGTEHDYKKQGLWDGMPDPGTGHRPCGSFGYGICKGCGSRWAQWDDAQPYVPSEEEWEREVAGPEADRAAQLRQWTEHHARRTDQQQATR